MTEKYLERVFLFAMMWTLGAVLEISERDKMEEYCLKHPSKLSNKFYIFLITLYLKKFSRMAQKTTWRNNIRVLCGQERKLAALEHKS